MEKFILIMCSLLTTSLVGAQESHNILYKVVDNLKGKSALNYEVKSSYKHYNYSDTFKYSAKVYYSRNNEFFQVVRSDSVYAFCDSSGIIIQYKDTFAMIYEDERSKESVLRGNCRFTIPNIIRRPEYLKFFLEEPWIVKKSDGTISNAIRLTFTRPVFFDSTTLMNYGLVNCFEIDTLNMLPVWYSLEETFDDKISVQKTNLAYSQSNENALPILDKNSLLGPDVVRKEYHIQKPTVKEALPKKIDVLAYLNKEEVNKQIPENHEKLILLDFWYIGCGMCELLNPHLKLVAEDFKDKLEVISLNPMDTSWTKISAKMLEEGITENYGKTNEKYLKDELKIHGYPTLILLDDKNNIIFRSDGFSYQKVQELREILSSY